MPAGICELKTRNAVGARIGARASRPQASQRPAVRDAAGLHRRPGPVRPSEQRTGRLLRLSHNCDIRNQEMDMGGNLGIGRRHLIST
jgi:hypothetical protein